MKEEDEVEDEAGESTSVSMDIYIAVRVLCVYAVKNNVNANFCCDLVQYTCRCRKAQQTVYLIPLRITTDCDFICYLLFAYCYFLFAIGKWLHAPVKADFDISLRKLAASNAVDKLNPSL